MSKSIGVYLAKGVVIGLCLFGVSSACIADIAVIVNPNSAIESLTTKQIKKLFLGRLRMLPNTELEATVIDQGESQQTYIQFYTKMINISPVKLKRYRAAYLFSGKGKLPTRVANDVQARSSVARDISAIAYIDSSLSDESVKVVHLLSLE